MRVRYGKPPHREKRECQRGSRGRVHYIAMGECFENLGETKKTLALLERPFDIGSNLEDHAPLIKRISEVICRKSWLSYRSKGTLR